MNAGITGEIVDRGQANLWRRRGLIMKTTAIPASHLPLVSRPWLSARIADFFALAKPRVMLLAVFTAIVGLTIAPGNLDALHASIAVLAIAAGAGAAGILNMWYDADIDAVMTRTAQRPIPRGTISTTEALAFGLILACSAVVTLALALNIQAAALLAFTIFFYVAVYTMWLKRSTPHNIVIGGAAGALPPVIGWAAATGEIGVEPLILFLIIFLWTPPHFWALSLNRADEYARAGVPMLPVVAGAAVTTRQILIYSMLLLPVSLLPWALGFAGAIYGATAVACGGIFIVLASRLVTSPTERRAAHRLFVFSIFYLFLLFATLLAAHSREPWSFICSPHDARAGAMSIRAGLLPGPALTAHGVSDVRTDEV
jgi:protoheme IX farnesyltransferase